MERPLPRPIEPPRLDIDPKRKKFFIRDRHPITSKPVKQRLQISAGDDRAAQKALALYILERERLLAERDFVQPADDDPTTSNPKLVSIERCLVFYGQKMMGTSNQQITGYHMAHLLRHWGGKTLAQIKGATCRAYWQARQREVFIPKGAKAGTPTSLSTARRELETLSAAVGVWHKEFNLTSRPIVTLPDKSDSHPDWMTDAEYQRLLRVTRGGRIIGGDHKRGFEWDESGTPQPHLERFNELAFASGSRAGVTLAMGWERDPEGIRGYVDLATLTIYRKGASAPRTRKRGDPCRIPDRLVSILTAWKAADMAEKAKVEAAGGTWVDRIVRYKNGSIKRIGQAFETAVDHARLQYRDIDGVDRLADTTMGKPTPHVLRHSRATLLLRAGVPPIEVAEFLSMSLKMLLDTYGHHHTEYQKAAAAAA